MKNVLFVCYGLGIGGIEKCLVNLINTMPVDEFDIDILLMNPEFDLRNQIKRNVRFLDSFKYVMNTTDTYPEIKRRGGIFKNLNIFIRYLFFRILNRYHKKSWILFRKLKKEYDYAVAYSHHDYSKYYVLDKVNAKKKYLFYHDGVYKLDDYQKQRDHFYYPRFNKIIAVSKCTKEMLVSIYPEISDKICVLHNIINSKEIVDLSNSRMLNKIPDTFYITTVGRLVPQKQVDVTIEIARKLKCEGYKFIWTWVGDGYQRGLAEQLISKYRLGDNFLLIGNVLNPYIYMKQCDLYVQPSKDEAYCTTTNEARILGKTIVTTNCSGMDEQIIDGVTGFILKNDVNELFEKIKFLINNVSILNELDNNVQSLNLDLSEYFNDYKKELFV